MRLSGLQVGIIIVLSVVLAAPYLAFSGFDDEARFHMLFPSFLFLRCEFFVAPQRQPHRCCNVNCSC